MSNSSHTTKSHTPLPMPAVQRRATITPTRPLTSGGETVEPKSDFLRDALRERKGLSPAVQSATPRRPKTVIKAQTKQVAHDEFFLPSSDDDHEPPIRRNPFRPQSTRRASEDVNIARASPNIFVRNLGLREADAQLDKLLKENWDLKHRITLHDQAYSKTRQDLDEALLELDKCATLRDRNRELEEAIVSISKQAAALEIETKGLKNDNAELTVLNDDLVRELEMKDEGIQQRQMAIEEAAGIIQTLEVSLESLKLQQQASSRTGSDYFSGDAGSALSTKNSARPTTSGTCNTDYTNLPDSDYFSGDNSPNITPSSPKNVVLDEEKAKAHQLERARTTGAAFNRKVGLRSEVSKDSLFSRFLDGSQPVPAKHTSKYARTGSPVKRRAGPLGGSIHEGLIHPCTPHWSDARELRAIHENGFFNEQIGSQIPNLHTGYTPSVTVASVSAAPSIDGLATMRTTHNVQATMSSLPTSSVSAAQPQHPTSDVKTSAMPTSRAHFPANPTPVNYNVWPRQLPEWPPSAGLRNRDILFHGSEMDEMFPVSPRRANARKEHLPTMNILYPTTTSERATRSLSAAPTFQIVAAAPPPPPPPLPARANSLSHSGKPFTAFALEQKRLSPMRRSNTLPPQ